MQIAGYEIQKQIGEGGMATAYLALQESLGRQVVLKILNTARQRNAENVERFLNEARIVASLNHPNVITIYDIGVAQDFIYMSMEYVEGGDLRHRMRTVITPPEALEILIKIGGGLSAAHKKGIVHRDVKPGNILFRKDGTPLLSDFGIAKRLTVDLDLTATGVFLGSPNYMAPEQAENGPVDGRADIYSLGIILFEMLTGTKPYRSESVVDIIVQHKHGPIPQLPPGLEQYQPLLNLMLAKDRKQRFRDAESMLHYIRNMQHSGALLSNSEIQHQPDFDISGEHGPAAGKTQKVAFDNSSSARRTPYILFGLLFFALTGYGALSYMASRYDLQKPGANVHDPVKAQQQLLPSGVEMVVKALSERPADLAPSATEPKDTATIEVIRALTWLANKSLEDFRLTYPPNDNAYYYFSRLLEIDPGNPVARQGILQIAERFAYLAEQELAENRYEQAQNYVDIGLKFDPTNETLSTLRSLAQSRSRGLFERLAELFKSG